MSALTTDEIAGALAAHGVPLLRTHHPQAVTLSPRDLITQLVRARDGRLAEALIALFLRHPEYAEEVPEAIAHLAPPQAYRLRHLYTAAVYLQRFWRTTLSLVVPITPQLPNLYGEEWQLPPPDIHYGEAGLRQLAAALEAESGIAWLTSYENAVHLLSEILALEDYTRG